MDASSSLGDEWKCTCYLDPFCICMGQASTLAQDCAGLHQARQTPCVFGRGETVCAVCSPLLFPPNGSGLFLWSL